VTEDPGLEAFIHLVGEGLEFAVQPQRKAQQRDQVGELALLFMPFTWLACTRA
jgi:hypothetical protein